MFVEKEFGEVFLFDEEPFAALMKREVVSVNTFIKPYCND